MSWSKPFALNNLQHYLTCSNPSCAVSPLRALEVDICNFYFCAIHLSPSSFNETWIWSFSSFKQSRENTEITFVGNLCYFCFCVRLHFGTFFFSAFGNSDQYILIIDRLIERSDLISILSSTESFSLMWIDAFVFRLYTKLCDVYHRWQMFQSYLITDILIGKTRCPLL